MAVETAFTSTYGIILSKVAYEICRGASPASSLRIGENKMKITVMGCGRWGTCIAWYLDKMGNDVTLYGRQDSKKMSRLMSERKNEYMSLSDTLRLTTDLDEAATNDIIIISIPSQQLSSFCETLTQAGVKNKTFVLCMKGIEIDTCKRLSEIVKSGTDKSNKVAVWLGPGHAQEFYAGIPNCMVIDSDDEDTKRMLVDAFSSELIRFYYGNDLIGNEIGAAAKNVIGIAAGMLDGLGLSTLKGALMSRGTREISRLIAAEGGNQLSAYGLCHLGDYEATVFSPYSNNRRFGEAFIKGEKQDYLAEGYYTVKALIEMAQRNGTELPICHAVYNILYRNADVSSELSSLFSRQIKNEF